MKHLTRGLQNTSPKNKPKQWLYLFPFVIEMYNLWKRHPVSKLKPSCVGHIFVWSLRLKENQE